jgi:hypothetical protein
MLNWQSKNCQFFYLTGYEAVPARLMEEFPIVTNMDILYNE